MQISYKDKDNTYIADEDSEGKQGHPHHEKCGVEDVLSEFV